MKKKHILALAMSVLMIGSLLTGCGSGDSAASADENTATAANGRTVEEIQADGTIRIGVFSDKAPFGYVDENGDYAGYDVYFAERIAKDLGVDVEYVSTDPASRVEFVETGKVDLILANFTVTEERAEKVDFCLPYMKVALGIVSPDSALIESPDQLNGKKLIVCKGTTAETYFAENYPDVELVKYDQYADAYNALLDGRGDGLSTDNTEVLAWALSNPGFSVGVDSLGNIDSIAPAVAKGNTSLLDWINAEIESLAAEQFFHNDYAETLAPVYGDAADPEALVVEGGVIE